MKPPGRGQEISQGRKPLVCSGFKPSPGRATEDSYLIAICRPSGARLFLYPYTEGLHLRLRHSSINVSQTINPKLQTSNSSSPFPGASVFAPPLVALRPSRAFHLISRLSNTVTAEPMRVAPPEAVVYHNKNYLDPNLKTIPPEYLACSFHPDAGPVQLPSTFLRVISPPHWIGLMEMLSFRAISIPPSNAIATFVTDPASRRKYVLSAFELLRIPPQRVWAKSLIRSLLKLKRGPIMNVMSFQLTSPSQYERPL
jgi:hypothetical protein